MHYQRANKFKLNDVIPYINIERRKKFISFSGYTISIKMTDQRMLLFKRTQKCACCFLKGNHFWLEKSGCYPWHFNLYGYKDNQPVMFTLDHILPKSKGGKTTQDNIQLLCERCNRIKKDHIITLEKLRKKIEKQKMSITKSSFKNLTSNWSSIKSEEN